MKRLIVGLAAGMVLVAVGQADGAILPYSITDLGTVAEGTYCTPYAINNRGEAVGVYRPIGGGSRAFIYDGSGIRDLGVPGTGSTVFDINDHGDVVGVYYTAPGGGGAHAFFRDGTTGAITDLFTVAGLTDAYAINNAGEIAGKTDTGAVLYDGTTLIDLGAFSTEVVRGGWSEGINEHGHVVGRLTVKDDVNPDEIVEGEGRSHRAFIYDGNATTLVDVSGFPTSLWSQEVAQDINSRGEVVGIYNKPGGRGGAFIYRNGSATDLGAFGLGSTNAQAINDQGYVVGYSKVLDAYQAFIHDGSEMLDLNTLSDASRSGWHLEYAFDINETGQIVGRGWHDGEARAFLLTPVPAPSSAVCVASLFAMGLIASWWRRRRNR